MQSVLPASLAAPPWHLYLGRAYVGPPRTDAIGGASAGFYTRQALDHFAFNGERSAELWSQRYYEDTTLWGGPGHPVFLSLGGEGPVGGPPSGLQRELAATHRAALISLEHRFYGESRPTADMSSTALRHLSAEQALADAAQFVEWWYPASVRAAVAYSGPILSQLDFYQYNQVVTAVLDSFGGAKCVPLLRAAFTQLVAALGRSGKSPGREGAARLLHACDVPESDDDDGVLIGSVQATTRYPRTHINPLQSCNSFAPASALGAALAPLAATLPARCLAARYSSYLAPLLDSNFSTGTPTNRQWFYQLCNEFGQQTCEPYATDCATGEAGLPPSVFAPFSHDDDLQRGLRLCEQLFGIRATPPALWTGKQRGWTNVAHGGRGIRASNVVFINGRRDPYSSVSLLPEQLSAAQTRLGVRSVAIANGSHCVGMEATSARDDPDVTAAKRAVREALAEWLGRPSLVS
ncbi:hypothetical protein EMIHUDRAFT_469381 [Emiliania huxleyi CCMP1516]|uniref:Peptidase S33 tripeptidyl aminopeptidase-like C-terminal domain-containing protein n=2 Tax=Emiliania huxleyi TaxID=2903 RepID=A0A0D3JKX6_EMIH1|nr:hypothetical protein EMIHUDRAFT_469381 [Emiliania huxleyi CCMP1516]EOD24161.1 hypothetical protein EMIHUDRAFT_469381 [Emiliania huxleyi CCMP1516]|eukprot:XP_005776590.1 hypothetical protein EMIHUDRAFT_469381 [Emiliania huxleyi CCMP1516]